MSLYLGTSLIAPNQSNAANKSLSNLDATGEAHFVKPSELATCHVVIETWHSGTEWYRVYDDGWCEQGGLAAVTNGQSGYSVALHKNYADVDYQVIVSPYGSAYSTYGYGAYNFTTNGFKIYCSVNTERKVFWQACGYIS